MNTRILTVLVALAAMFAGGCKHKAEPLPPNTPPQALWTLIKSMETGDKDAFLTVLYFPGDDLELRDVVYEAKSAKFKLALACETAYGKGRGAEFVDYWPLAKDDIDKLAFKEDGDKAHVTPPRCGRIHLLRQGDRWLVDLSIGAETAKQRTATIAGFKAIIKAAADVRPKVGRAGETAEHIFHEFAQASITESVIEQPTSSPAAKK